MRRQGKLGLVALCLLALPLVQAQSQPAEFAALQAHFDRIISTRHALLFRDLSSLSQWEERKRHRRLELAGMLWHDRKWPAEPPPVRITHRTELPAYVVENVVLETAPR